MSFVTILSLILFIVYIITALVFKENDSDFAIMLMLTAIFFEIIFISSI